MWKTFATVAFLLPLQAQCGERVDPPPPLQAELHMLVGEGALDCGFVRLGTPPESAWKCAEFATTSGTAHWFALEQSGVDSDVWIASLLDQSGRAYVLEYDSNYMGGPGLQPRFTRATCNGRIVFKPAASRPLQCGRK